MSDDVFPSSMMDNGACIGPITDLRKSMPAGFRRDLIEMRFLGGIPLSWYLRCHNLSNTPFAVDTFANTPHDQQEENYKNTVNKAKQDINYVQWITSKIEDGIQDKITTATTTIMDGVYMETDLLNERIFQELDAIEGRVFAEIKLIHQEVIDNNSTIKRDIVKYHNDFNDRDLSMYILVGQIIIAIIGAFLMIVHYTAPINNDIILFNRELL